MNPNIPSPTGRGWNKNDNHLDIVWMENQPASESLLELVVCDCRRPECDDNCQRRLLSMECTEACKCAGNCENIVRNVDSDSELDIANNQDADDVFE